MDVEIRSATGRDKARIAEFFSSYGSKELAKNRAECYTSHNHTVVADKEKEIVGLLQWRIREDPHLGVAELEEIEICEEIKESRVGEAMIEFGIKSIKEEFKKLGVKGRKVYLFVCSDNVFARRLYERIGFRNVVRLGFLFDDSKEELFYAMNL